MRGKSARQAGFDEHRAHEADERHGRDNAETDAGADQDRALPQHQLQHQRAVGIGVRRCLTDRADAQIDAGELIDGDLGGVHAAPIEQRTRNGQQRP